MNKPLPLATDFPAQLTARVMQVLGLALFAYTCVRAFTVDLTIDELYTMEHYLQFDPYPDLYDTTTANYHWLNSWLMKGLSLFAGTDPFVMRLPALAGHVLFLVFGGKLLLRMLPPVSAVLCFILLNMHPYLLDFFSLARGYGLSLGLMMLAIWLLYKMFTEGFSLRPVLLLQFTMNLMVLSAFTTIYFFLCANALLCLWFIRIKQQRFKLISATAAFTLLLLAVLVPHLRSMKQSGALFFGGDTFWNGSVKTLVEQITYGASYVGENAFASSHLTIWLLMAGIFIAAFVMIRKQGISLFARSFFGNQLLLFFSIIVLMMVQHHLDETLYPLQRTVLFLLPLFLLLMFSALLHWKKHAWTRYVLAILCCPVLFHFFSSANVSYAFEWKSAGRAEEIMKIIANDAAVRHPGQTVTVTANGVNGSTLQYCARKQNANMLVNPYWPEDTMPAAHYYFVEKSMLRFHARDERHKIYYDPITGNTVYRDQESWK